MARKPESIAADHATPAPQAFHVKPRTTVRAGPAPTTDAKLRPAPISFETVPKPISTAAVPVLPAEMGVGAYSMAIAQVPPARAMFAPHLHVPMASRTDRKRIGTAVVLVPHAPMRSSCEGPNDCVSNVCALATCVNALCTDGVRNGDETDIDCGGSCGPCGNNAACTQPGDCASRVCDGGRCATPSCTDGVRNGDETDVDCGGSCPPCANGGACEQPADCGSGVCSRLVCATPSCTDGVLNGSETDVDCGGQCNPCPDGRTCSVERDCASSVCRSNTCSQAACNDGVRNGTETDIDCGGACSPCGVNRSCDAGRDCTTGVCNASTCTAAVCTDGVRNGDETDVDCGGSCPACASGRSCAGTSDCVSRVCSGSRCAAPTCTDRVQNGSETDTDCGGAGCPGCAVGSDCVRDSDCASEQCSGTQCILGNCPPPSEGDISAYAFDGDLPTGPITDIAGPRNGLVRGSVSPTPGPNGCGEAIAFPADLNSYVEIPDASAWDLSTGSVDLWIRPDAIPNSGAGIVGRDANDQVQSGHFTLFLLSDGFLMVRLQNDVFGEQVTLCSERAVSLGSWTRVTINWGPPRAELWIDGTRSTFSGQVTNDLSNTSTTIQCGGDWPIGIGGNDNPWIIGVSPHRSDEGIGTPTAKPFRGAVDHVRISNTRRSF